MNKRKLRINGMDIVILAVIAAALALLLYIFVWSAGPESTEQEYVDLVYVLEVTSLEGQFQNLVQAGQPVLDAIKRGNMGTVVSTPHITPMKKAEFDNDTRQEVYNEVPGRYRMLVSIEASAVVTEQGYTVGDQDVYVGALMSLVFPNLKCDGYCIDLEIAE